MLAGAAAIAAEDYDHLAPVTSQDEFGTLAEGLNASLGKLRERFEMLKFLPSHTARMIRTALSSGAGVGLDTGQRIRVAVLETDIRGFTKLSSSMAPEQVITMLNTYIRAQADGRWGSRASSTRSNARASRGPSPRCVCCRARSARSAR